MPNAIKDPTVSTPENLELCRLHEALDCAVLDAYDHSPTPTSPVLWHHPGRVQVVEDEVLDFLFERNELLAKQVPRAAKRAQS